MDFTQSEQQVSLVGRPSEPAIILTQGQTYTLQGGAVLDFDGTITYPGGAKLVLVIEDGKIVGQQILKPDGTKLQVGEVLMLPDGTLLKQVSNL